jgi:two-component system phosphate regulon response regulator PhoB
MKKILLVIEDDLDTLSILDYLMQDNYEVVSFPKLIPIADVIAINPDIVLVDHWLPNGHGSDFCLAIKKNPGLSSTPVILISTYAELKTLAAECCADAYIEKPFNIEALTSLIKSF